LLHPDVVVRMGPKKAFRGAKAVAERAQKGGAGAARVALVDGAVGVVVAPRGKLLMVLRLKFDGEQIVAIDAVTEPQRLAALDLAVFESDVRPS
jgi:RNA polymerase sigma-70 factor (ECF subfamily)